MLAVKNSMLTSNNFLCCLISLVSGCNVVFAYPFYEEELLNGPFGILNGSVTNVTKHPYQAAIYDEDGFKASGAIVDRYWIVTSAQPPSLVEKGRVQVGITNISDVSNLIAIEKILLHPKYNLGTNYNFALLKLKAPLTFSENVKTISIAPQSPRNRTTVVATGWGVDKNRSGDPSTLLRKAELLIVPRAECSSTYPASIVSDTSICAYKEEVELSNFDAGNPIVENNKLVGIFLGYYHNFFCKKSPCPYIFTDLTLVKRWIEGEVRRK